MAELRIGRGWSETEIEERLRRAHDLERNYSAPEEEMTVHHGWNEYYSEAVVGIESPGPAVEEGPFAKGRSVVATYEFSDPGVVIGHFDPSVPLLGRRMLLELRALRFMHYLGGVVIGAVRDEVREDSTVFGFRYDTLEGHIERGSEWFLLTKNHVTGEIRFRIQAAWLPGDFPNWWSRVGFKVLVPYYQRAWHERAHAILARLMRLPEDPATGLAGERIIHTDPDVIFKRIARPQ